MTAREMGKIARRRNNMEKADSGKQSQLNKINHHKLYLGWFTVSVFFHFFREIT